MGHYLLVQNSSCARFLLSELNGTIWRSALLKCYAGTALLLYCPCRSRVSSSGRARRRQKGWHETGHAPPAALCLTAPKDEAQDPGPQQGPWWWGRAEAIQEGKPGLGSAREPPRQLQGWAPRLSTEQLPGKGLELPREHIASHSHTAAAPRLIPG